ncbi:D-alanyl-D-alanine carboxypeptidase [Dyadobacter sp. BE34]|uniref:D-alanyl-D-alanine carboxypeptidase n=1 Tax=Dyadobacter fermentans TaxID=94254 RepID=A0ABU1QXB2_9BACT|nr:MULTISPECIES: serine hydrolase domain-containing protein [Dyadobacter]MDR6804910.1 D-alanyl-D-alanine carboxypeptidase [Dyadobacter fermentans]MDR7043331.1 D-alanyl-D-alanine carboxypeptidase [Dyadobacter sp. BE242]MDR7197643.1 D-alanyl-D-alanine carboxypeptidase [Dyadobacter sp. BE34]MDR7214924.1 D-alanyl-D-alanine carboxypeptidase [Dyadobacter sp. BE31]MDR7262459.1 D-alanyl-D-alanine carboxypeptidase [Dyadobacter sp. BE32]
MKNQTTRRHARPRSIRTALQAAFLIPMLAIWTLSCTTDHVPPGDHPDAEKYQRIVTRFMEAGASGVSVTVRSPKGIWHGAGGNADKGKGMAMTPENTLRIGSMSKVFTAVTILRLQEEGRLSITDKISQYLPAAVTSRIANAGEATIEQCLNHTSGIREYLGDETIEGIAGGRIVKYSAAQNLALVYDKPADFPLGKGNYCNTNYLLLSEIIRAVSGKSAYHIVREKAIEPLGLRNTSASVVLPASLTQSYFETDGVMQEVTWVDNNAVGGEGQLDGGMISTSGDMAAFLEALLTGKILSPASLALMQTYQDIDPGTLPDELKYYKQYGLGLMKIETDHGTAIGHDGHVYGFVGKVFYLPEHQTTIAILLNGWSPSSVAVLNAKSTFNLLF